MTNWYRYRQAMMNNELRWCVVSIPTESWAAKVFAQEDGKTAVAKLWQEIFATVRIDEEHNPVEAWQHHIAFLQRACKFMNEQKFTALKYSNSLGTKLTVGLPEGHIWAGGAEIAGDGVEFVANMPTEEIYTLPDRNRVDGVVYASKPLNYNGNLIEGIFLGIFGLSTFIPWIHRFLYPEIWGECFWNGFTMLWYCSGYLGYLVMAHYIRVHLDWSRRRRAITDALCSPPVSYRLNQHIRYYAGPFPA